MVTLIKCVSCCSSDKNLLTIRLFYGIWSLLTLAIVTIQGAAIYSNVDFLSNPSFEPICSAQQEHFIESEGKESSLILEFKSNANAEKGKSCTRILSAPSNYGFIVRLILPKIRHGRTYQQTTSQPTLSIAATSQAVPLLAKSNDSEKTKVSTATALNEMTQSIIDKLNSTALKSTLGRTCPLSIFSSIDPHRPQWRVDPCQLEDTAPEMEDPVRLFRGRVRIVWEHGGNTLKSKLMVTVLGKGDQCRSENKHQCLKIGDEPILCISKDLVCDGIRHCPYSNEYDSDEDFTMCWKRRRFDEPIPPAMESDVFEHFALEVFRNLFAFDVSRMPEEETGLKTKVSTTSAAVNSTTLRKVDTKPLNETRINTNGEDVKATDNATTVGVDNSTESFGNGHHHRRNSTRLGLNSDLSKYGPWGYLMLGMLLCGGALLICGLWASASQHAANNERESALQNGGAGYNGSSLEHQSGTTAPPNYEELDPPPAYSVLFPNQKAASSATLSSLAAATITGEAAATAAATAASIALSPPATTAANTTTTTRAQLETATTSNSHQIIN